MSSSVVGNALFSPWTFRVSADGGFASEFVLFFDKTRDDGDMAAAAAALVLLYDGEGDCFTVDWVSQWVEALPARKPTRSTATAFTVTDPHGRMRTHRLGVRQ